MCKSINVSDADYFTCNNFISTLLFQRHYYAELSFYADTEMTLDAFQLLLLLEQKKTALTFQSVGFLIILIFFVSWTSSLPVSKHKVDIQQSPFIFIFDSVSQHSSLLIVIMSVWDLREVYSEFTFKYYVHSLQCNVNAKELNAFYYITNAFLCYAFLDKTKVFLPFTLF